MWLKVKARWEGMGGKRVRRGMRGEGGKNETKI
jgi:hypothetical protein